MDKIDHSAFTPEEWSHAYNGQIYVKGALLGSKTEKRESGITTSYAAHELLRLSAEAAVDAHNALVRAYLDCRGGRGDGMRALDLFCKAGGASMGLHRAGFDVVGVDIEPQPNYPFAFVQADALTPPFDLSLFGFVWASPPCQKYSWSARRWDKERADLVEPTRELLAGLHIPTVIENVVGAPIRPDLILTGPMFGLGVIRRRHFETNFFCLQPAPVSPTGSVRTGEYVTVAGHGGDNIKGRGSRAAKQKAMGIDWMNDEELNNAIPPAYAEFIGRAAMAQLRAAAWPAPSAPSLRC